MVFQQRSTLFQGLHKHSTVMFICNVNFNISNIDHTKQTVSRYTKILQILVFYFIGFGVITTHVTIWLFLQLKEYNIFISGV